MTDDHPAITLRRHLHQIADALPGLTARLGGGSGTDRSGVHATPASRPPIDLHVSDLIAEVRDWAIFLARVLMDEVTVTVREADQDTPAITAPWSPTSTDTVAILHQIADTRTGHFTEHEDRMLAVSVCDDTADLARRVERTAHPTGARRVPLHIPCTEHTTSDQGERVACTGSLYVRLTPDEAMSDFICSADPAHRITPLEWQRGQRRDVARERDMDALLHSGRVRYSSERGAA